MAGQVDNPSLEAPLAEVGSVGEDDIGLEARRTDEFLC